MTLRLASASVLVLVGLLCGAASASARPAIYAGHTRAGEPFVLTTSGKQLRSMTLHWIASCPSGGVIPFAGTVRYAGQPPSAPPPSLRDGKSDLYTTALSKTGRFTGNIYGLLDLGPRYWVMVSGVLAGRLTKTGGSGGYTMTVSVFDAAKRNLLERCSASAKWTVAHNARTYGGSTSQGDPVAITLNAKRTKISDMYVAYHMDCGGGTYLEPGDDFTFVVRRGGRFGARFEDDVTIAGGGGASRKIFYDVGGIVRPTTATGTLTVSTLEVDAAGNPQTVGCGTPDVTWKAMTG